ncbi:MAG: CpaF family protein [Deltaproteobacteria bacterium]|nr:CpaF family protein [Deltaproteobacteria bacterium]
MKNIIIKSIIWKISSMELANLTHQIITKLNQLTYEEFALGDQSHQEASKNKMQSLIENLTEHLSCAYKKRIQNEFFSYGPLEELLKDEETSEIIINDPVSIFFEKNGTLIKHTDYFLSEYTYEKFIQRLCDQTSCILNLESPFADGSFENFRISIIDKSITHHFSSVNFRRHPLTSWTFKRLIEKKWCSEVLINEFQKIISERKNFLVIGSTGSGKTSVLNSLLNLTQPTERSIIIEDTSEISLPNKASMKLLTQSNPNNIKTEINQTDLVKRSLRLRPDRIVMGEIRGSEAKDFLMALSTGHLGSFGTLHAHDPHQALIRLEMLIQMGAPNWSLSAIRRLIFLSLDMVLVVGKNASNERCFKGAYQLCSLEENGFLLEKKF